MSFMRKMNKKMTMDPHLHQQFKKFPNINPSEFNNKFNDLLDKVSIQNRYATRISQANIKNLQQLQEAKKQLRKIAEQKKMDQLKAADTKQFVEQMTARVRDSETELQKIFKEILNAKKEIRHLKCIISDLENENLNLEKQVVQAKRQRFDQICLVRKQLDQNLLATQMGKYLVESLNMNSILYKFCLSIHKSNNYQNFFKQLEIKLQKQVKIREKDYAIKSSTTNKNTSNMKLKTPSKLFFKSNSKGNSMLKRYKTQHNKIATAQDLNHSIN